MLILQYFLWLLEVFSVVNTGLTDLGKDITETGMATLQRALNSNSTILHITTHNDNLDASLAERRSFQIPQSLAITYSSFWYLAESTPQLVVVGKGLSIHSRITIDGEECTPLCCIDSQILCVQVNPASLQSGLAVVMYIDRQKAAGTILFTD